MKSNSDKSVIPRLRAFLGNALFGGGFLLLLVSFGIGYVTNVSWLAASIMIVAGFFIGETWKLVYVISDMLAGPPRM